MQTKNNILDVDQINELRHAINNALADNIGNWSNGIDDPIREWVITAVQEKLVGIIKPKLIESYKKGVKDGALGMIEEFHSMAKPKKGN